MAVSQPSYLCRLPAELKINIMSNSASLRDLSNLVTSCKPMFHTFKDAEGLIVHGMLVKLLGKAEVALATAHHSAVTVLWKYSKDPAVPLPTDQTNYTMEVTAFCEKYRK
ncbi:hypothetical protein F5Y19DRAFT_449908 [Xylariaceae sp. FL1651]|nr:hypothetical protein F5Y19DRAFT_449908 [Xylariaceae sp. FL1651]